MADKSTVPLHGDQPATATSFSASWAWVSIMVAVAAATLLLGGEWHAVAGLRKLSLGNATYGGLPHLGLPHSAEAASLGSNG